MPQLGNKTKKKDVSKSKETISSKEVVSAYSEEGIRRNKKKFKPLSVGFKVFLFLTWTLLAVGAFLIIFGPSFGWW